MLEIEQKYSSADFAAVERRLRDLGAGDPVVHDEADHYFNAPDRDFAKTSEAFRLRRIGEANYLTYKGPRQKGALRIRREVEIPLPPGAEAAGQHMELLTLLGYRPVAVVRKRRASYALTIDGLAVHACLDDVAHVGRYAEVEVVAEQEQADHAAAVLGRLSADLGLSEVEPRSYLALTLAKQAESGVAGVESSTPRTAHFRGFEDSAPATHGGMTPPGPVVISTVAELRQYLAEARRQRKTVGLVPTMGALHEGHASLIRAARTSNDVVVVSIFVNPTQFGPHEDLARYPRPFADDVRLCAGLGVEVIFHPPPEEVYPAGYRSYVEVTGIQDVFEGAIRPGHFRGVATVVLKLFNQAQPDRAYFGQKDAQQVRVVQQMVRDLEMPVEVVVCPTVREPDGLALSSRNRYLDPSQRAQAVALFEALTAAEALYTTGVRDPAALEAAMRQRVEATPGATLDYAAALDADSFAAPEQLDRGVLLALAVRLGPTRLIDNMLLK